MRLRTTCAGVVFAAALAALVCRDAVADLDGRFYVADSTRDVVLCFQDRDGDGVWTPGGTDTVVTSLDDSSGVIEPSIISHLAFDGEQLVVLDGGRNDTVLLGNDVNGDGDVNDEGEGTVFYSSQGAVSLSTPNAIVLSIDGRWYITDDGSRARRIICLQDLNGDGDALDDGEATIVLGPDADGNAPIQDPESLAAAPDGSLYVGSSSEGLVYRLVDIDRDGRFFSPGELAVFARFPEEVDLDALEVGDDGALWIADEDSADVYRARDGDGDGAALSEGELALYIDASQFDGLSDLNDMDLLPGDGLLLIDGSSDSVFIARDVDGNGSIGEGELVRWLDGGEFLSTPSAIVYVPADPGPVDPLEGSEFVRGDANGDQVVDVADAVVTLDYLFAGGALEACLDSADSDDSGDVDITDPIVTLLWLFSEGPPLPAPFPDAGADPTPDDLCPAPAA